MAEIAPLTPLRYDLSRADLAKVTAPPYDVIGAEQRADLAARDPHNVVKLILPEGEGDAKYANAAKELDAWTRDRVLVRDEVPAFYRYDQSFAPPGAPAGTAKIRRRGFLGLVKLVALDQKIVLPHERTLSGPKEDRLKLFRATRTNLSPGFMLYEDKARALDAALEVATPLADFESADGVSHALAKIVDADAVKHIMAAVAKSSLLIADGHHRYETALRYSKEIAENAANRDDERAEYKYFMVFFANGDDPNLVVFPTHRFVHDLPHFAFGPFVERAKALFEVTRFAPSADAGELLIALRAAKAEGPSFAACTRHGAALLTLKKDVDLAAHPVLGAQIPALRRTDVAILHGALLEDILGITKEAQAAKTNLWYPQDAPAALADVRAGKGDVLFLMNATPVADVREVAEAGEVMPQKSTFFYPKVLTGLAIHTLHPTRSVAR